MTSIENNVVTPDTKTTTDKQVVVPDFSDVLGIYNLADAERLMSESINQGKQSLWTIIKVMSTVESKKLYEQDGYKTVNDWAAERYGYSASTLANYHTIMARADLMALEGDGWSVSSVERIKALPVGTDISGLSPDMTQKELNVKVKEIKATLTKDGGYKPRKKKAFRNLPADKQESILNSKVDRCVTIILDGFDLTSTDTQYIKQVYEQIGRRVQTLVEMARAEYKAQQEAEKQERYRESAQDTMEDAESLSLEDKQTLIQRLTQMIAEEQSNEAENK